MKKIYSEPQCEVVNLELENNILSGSAEGFEPGDDILNSINNLIK